MLDELSMIDVLITEFFQIAIYIKQEMSRIFAIILFT